MSNYLFKTVIKQRDLEGLAGSGLIGLSPYDGTGEGDGLDERAPQMFVPSLYNQGAIKNNMFSMFIDQSDVSMMQIGGYDLAKYAKGPITWHKLTSDYEWGLGFGNVRVGDFTFVPSTHSLIVDSGASLNIMPSSDYFKIVNHFFSNSTCKKMDNTLTQCVCSAEEHAAIPDITFKIEGKTYIIPRDEWYVRSPEHGKCVIKIMHNPYKTIWQLGLNFMTTYYTVFDIGNKRLGFAESIKNGFAHSEKFREWAFATEAKTKLMNLLVSIHENLNPINVTFETYWEMVALSFLTTVAVISAKRKTSRKQENKAIEVSNEEF